MSPDNHEQSPLLEASPRVESSQPGCFSVGVFVLTWLWIVLVVLGATIAHLAISSFSLLIPNWNFVVIQAATGMILAIPLLALTLFWRSSIYKPAFKTWLLASIFTLLLAPIHFLPANAALLQGLARIILITVFIALVSLFSDLPGIRLIISDIKNQFSNPSWRIALIIGTIFFFPWLAWGALGSALDTIFQIIVGFTIGVAIVYVIQQNIETDVIQHAPVSKRRYFYLGFTMGTTIYIMSAGTAFPYGGMQLLIMICLPPLGWTILALNYNSQSYELPKQISIYWLPLIVLVGLAASAPLAFIDPDELLLISSANAGDILQWALYSAGLSAIIGIVASLIFSIYIYTRRFTNKTAPKFTRLLNGLTIICIIIGAWIYITIGQPGFHGEGLFVILKTQVDTREAQDIQDYGTRRHFVYDTLTEHANTTQKDLRRIFDNLGIEYTPYYLVNAIQVRGGPLLRLWLESRPEVDRVIDNPWLRPLHAPLPTSSGYAPEPTSSTWNIEMIKADLVWQEFDVTGEGIIIGQSDSGVDGGHKALSGSYRGKLSGHDYNWLDPWNGSTQPTDLDGHGTQSLGIILGQQIGVAPGASWYGCVNLARNLGNPSVYLDCMQFMLSPFPIGGDPFINGEPSLGAHISNNSWGCPPIEGCDTSSLLPAVRAMRDAGIFVVASAGNDGPGCESLSVPLPIYEETFAVGSINQFGQLSDFSSLGPVTADGSGRTKPDIVAPGEDVLSAMPNNSYAYSSGTSFSGPHVAGVVALIWSANPNLIGDIDQTADILAKSAQPYTGNLPLCEGSESYPSTAVGYGILDAYAAVEMALSHNE